MKLRKKLNKIIVLALILILFFPYFSYAAEETVVSAIKKSVAMWYFILRNISIIIMLVLLIFIGIKMTISTIASEKAVYKQMLLDWVVGMIIVFSIHYLILFIITFNEMLVGIISETTAKTVKVERFVTNVDQTNNVELEMTLYDEVKTRAYDPKLTVGTTGMIMYMFLVYYTFKFTFIYLKRYLIVIVLTLMAPIVAMSYAFNKVLTGKSKIFSTWTTEFIMNVLIQSLHAFIYASFISMALRLSLMSVAGFIFAFMLLNFMSKAEALFRRIFKMSEKGSIAENLSDASDPIQHAQQKLNTVSNLVLGNRLAKDALQKSARLVTKPFRAARKLCFWTCDGCFRK